MKIVIIEDEKLTAEDLAGTIASIDPDARILSLLFSVKEAVSWFRNHEMPDLIFSDIQLGDGLSFEIFKTVKIQAPVIFCTAYDEFALNAFKANGIDYILKPFSSKTIAEALQKYKTLIKAMTENGAGIDAILDAMKKRESHGSTSILVHFKDKILPVKLMDIALFYIENETTHLLTFDGKTHFLNKNLEEIQQQAGRLFFRVNRQCLVNRKAVVDATQYFSRKLSINLNVPFSHALTVSKEKIPQFLQWLEYEQ